ncbi:MG2 domain-containing protein [Longimicrobium sp.]|uniref:alpha-2-macroglobulin family protein n=1 Tax=Longimicrobium sp. TaxID=2029185 RepID=UPI003B3B50AD
MFRVSTALVALLGFTGVFVLRAEPAQQGPPVLGVLRTAPEAVAQPEAVVTVTFDRPVAGGLDETVDAEALFTIEPQVEGRVEWRDPVTLRFTPAAPLRPGASYTVTIANDFAAMDGARLPRPHRFTFRVERARVLTGWPVGPHRAPKFLEPGPRFFVLVSSAVQPDELAGVARLVLGKSCGGAAPIGLRGVGVRPIGEADPDWVAYFGATGNAGANDLRRVVELAPARPLPPGCAAELVLPAGMDPPGDGDGPLRWAFSTYGPLRVVEGGCPRNEGCHYGPAVLQFSTPVRGSEVLRHVHIDRDRPFTVRDTAAEQDRWVLEGRLQPRRGYTITVDPQLTDVFGQRLGTPARLAFTTPGVPPSVIHPHGKLVVEREGFRTLAVQHVNVDTLLVDVAAVPDSLEARLLSRGWGGWNEVWTALEPSAARRRIPVRGERDRSAVTGVVLAAPDARRTPRGTLMLVQVGGRGVDSLNGRHPLALVQVTDLAVHVRVGVDQAAVWVTGVKDGRPRADVDVTLHDGDGRVRATGRTDGRGTVVLTGFRPEAPPPAACTEGEECEWTPPVEGYVAAQRGADRAVVGISEYDPDLSPYRFGLSGAWGEERAPAAGAVFTERGIYRPGEPVYAKAIVRRGPLGSLAPPAPGDSLRWLFTGREGEPLRDQTVPLSRFGTADHTFRLPADVALGDYNVEIRLRRDGQWRSVGFASYQVAEYRPPEFLVEVGTGEEPRFSGDRLRATVGSRYLFGAPMARAPVRWTARQTSVSPWEIQIPGTEGWYLGDSGEWWEDSWEAPVVLAGGTDSLDARGYRELDVVLPPLTDGRPARVTVQAEVVDANRQTVAGLSSVLVHPADFYVAARPEGSGYFWTAGTPVRVGVIAVRPDGRSVSGVAVQGAVVRREWHTVRRQRGGAFDEVGEWVTDTVATCRVTTAAQPATCAFTPRAGGAYTFSFQATDGRGRKASTTFTRWSVGGDWVPWNDEGKFKMDVIPDRERYSPGDTATVLVASPFTDAEAWVTVERERVLEQRRIRITSGTTTLKIPITEAFAPNAFVSVIVVRGRSAAPGTVDDPGRPTLRVGYTQLRVTPEVKRLAVEVSPLQPEYRPGDSARIRVRVRDGAGRPQVSEVTLWAVDEGVLSLTGYRTPDPLDLLYQPRGVGMRLGSNLVAVAPQVPEGQKGTRDPGGSGGQDLSGILRSRFRSTAFFVGSVVTDANGEVVVAGGLPDNVTTFRVMAVAVTAGDRYGAGESPLLSTRPLIARPALPRFLREGDDFMAGVVVNHRFAQGIDARVTAEARGVMLTGDAERTVSLLTGRGAEARFRFAAPIGDSATFRFGVTGGGEADAVEVRIPIRPANRPVVQTSAGVLRDTATVQFILPAEVDPARSSLELGFGTSPLALVQAYNRRLELYPYGCTEQISSQALPLIALHRARQASGATVPGNARARIELVVRTLERRQRTDGGIGLWSALDWTSPFLTAYAGRVMLEARAGGVQVSDTVLNRMAGYVARALGEPEVLRAALGPGQYRMDAVLTERLAAADFLSRLGRPDVPAENVLLGQAARLSWEDRLALAEMLARRGATEPARRLLAAAWEGVQIRGSRAVIPEAAYRRDFYFASHVRPAARLLTATLAVQPGHPGIGALVETLVQQGRAEARLPWTTQDYGAAVLALLAFEETQRDAPERAVRLVQGDRTVLETRARRGEARDTVPSLAGLLQTLPDGRRVLRLTLEAPGGGVPIYYDLSVREVVSRPTLTPLDRGIAVERWYETLDTRRPITGVVEGQVVRVRLRVTVPEERQMVILDDPLPAGLEAVDLSLRTVSPFPAGAFGEGSEGEDDGFDDSATPVWAFGSWDSGMWSAFDHREIRDDRVIYFARMLWKGTYSATYLARATTAGRFTMAPAHAEEMYNPGVHGRSGGGAFTVTPAAP